MTTTTATAETLVVAEVFGPTVQGEGPSCGRRAAFVRLGGCNLSCAWCDTPYTWDATRHDLRIELTRTPAADITARVATMGAGLTVITGGEPLLHQRQPAWVVLLDGLVALGDVEIETNGTIAPTGQTITRPVRFNVSPKLAHAGDPRDARINPAALASFAALTHAGRAAWKFVAASPADLDEITGIVNTYSIPRRSVWVMPEGTTAESVTNGLRTLAGPVIDAGLNLAARMHTIIWGQERGR